MKDMLKKIFIWFFSVVICGFFVGVLGNRFYYEYFEKTNLSYASETFRLAYKDANLRKNLKITINGRNVSELYITTITLINNGNAPLSRPDFKAESDPLRIHGRHIESVFVDKINTTANSRINLVKRRGGTRVNFRWINPGDKIVLKVVHHKPSDNVRVRGSFQGISRISRLDSDYDKLAYTRRALMRAWITGITGTLMFIFVILGIMMLLHRINYGVWYMNAGQNAVFYMITSAKKMSRATRKKLRMRVAAAKTDDALRAIYDEFNKKKSK